MQKWEVGIFMDQYSYKLPSYITETCRSNLKCLQHAFPNESLLELPGTPWLLGHTLGCDY